MTFEYVCVDCGQRLQAELHYECPHCSGILDVRTSDTDVDPSLFDDPVTTLSKYEPLLPVSVSVSLGEGGTPLTKAETLSTELGVELYLKQEGINPTCSFKDRPNAVGISYIEEMDIDIAIISSHGNAGASFAAYANKAGIKPVVLVPKGSSAGLPKVKSYHPKTIPVDGDISDTYTLAKQAARQFGWYNGTTTHQAPLANTGNRTFAYELYDQLDDAPDWILVPVSAGPLLTQTYRGFKELQALGFVEEPPAMVGLQVDGCAPIAKAARENEKSVDEWSDDFDTIATSIEDPLRGYAKDGTYTLEVIRKSGGVALVCDGEALVDASRDLARAEGVLAETASATTIVALRKLRRQSVIDSGDVVVGAVTGHGLNELRKLSRGAREHEDISVDIKELKQSVVDSDD